MGGMFGGWGKDEIQKGRKRAIRELDKSYEGPIKGLEIAPEFYKLLNSPELKNTPLGRSLALQNQILGEVSAGLGGRAFGARRGGLKGAGAIPPDMAQAIGENLGSYMGAQGTTGSPVGAIMAAQRFGMSSEAIRQQRLASAQSALGQIGGGSLFPSASEFLQVGANKAQTAAQIQMNAGLAEGQAEQERLRQINNTVNSVGKAIGAVVATYFGGPAAGAAVASANTNEGGAAGFGNFSVGGGAYSGLGANQQYYDAQTGRQYPIFGGGENLGSGLTPFGAMGSSSGGSYEDPYFQQSMESRYPYLSGTGSSSYYD